MSRLKRCMQVDKCPDCKMRNEDNECVALSSTYFYRKCPFYKKGNYQEFKKEYYEEDDEINEK